MHTQNINVLDVDFDARPWTPELVDDETHEVLRVATDAELKASVVAARRSLDGIGRIQAEGRRCYVL